MTPDLQQLIDYHTEHAAASRRVAHSWEVDKTGAGESMGNAYREDAAHHDGMVATLNEVASEIKRAERWRSWAQFVYLGGGRPEGSDEEMQKRVCEVQSEDVQALREENVSLRMQLRVVAGQVSLEPPE